MASITRLFSKASVLLSAILAAACSANPTVGPSIAAATQLENENAAPTELIPCPGSPNCVNSQDSTSSDSQVPPFTLATDKSLADQLEKLSAAITADGGKIREARPGYIWATYTSTVFRFVDDIEWLHDPKNNVLHVRSASRTGYSDFGVNRKRVERLRTALTTNN